MMQQTFKTFCIGSTIAVGLGITCAHAGDINKRIDAIVVINGFYDLLADQSAARNNLDAYQQSVASRLTSAATIELTDLGVTQTAEEFVDGLELFHEALDGGALAWRVEPADDSDGEFSALVCYSFSSNSVLNRETVVLENGMISEIRQTPVADHCDDL